MTFHEDIQSLIVRIDTMAIKAKNYQALVMDNSSETSFSAARSYQKRFPVYFNNRLSDPNEMFLTQYVKYLSRMESFADELIQFCGELNELIQEMNNFLMAYPQISPKHRELIVKQILKFSDERADLNDLLLGFSEDLMHLVRRYDDEENIIFYKKIDLIREVDQTFNTFWETACQSYDIDGASNVYTNTIHRLRGRIQDDPMEVDDNEGYQIKLAG